MSALTPNAFSDFEFVKPSRSVDEIFIHCSASDYAHHDNVATMRTWHLARGWTDVGYHFFIRKNGTLEFGRSLEKTPAAQAGHNRGTIAICVHGLDVEKFTTEQMTTLQALCMQINRAYMGLVGFRGHCEVAAKACPVFDYKDVLKLTSKAKLGVNKPAPPISMATSPDMAKLEAPETNNYSDLPILKIGMSGAAVLDLQERLTSLNYPVGDIDGKFGTLTRTAVLAFQADNHLIEDGKVGSSTYEALEDATPRELSTVRSKASLISLAGKSRITQASIAQGAAGGAIGLGGVAQILEETSGTVTEFTSYLGTFGAAIKSLGPWIGLIVIVGAIFIVWQSIRAGRARLDDHRSGKTL